MISRRLTGRMVCMGAAFRLVIGMLAAAGSAPAAARVLDVGPERAYPAPSAAAAAAQDGDTVSIAPGTYYDCAFWRRDRLTIAGTGPGVVITDRACGGKAAFVISGNDTTIRGLTFARIRVPDGNGAGIRAEGRGLTVEDSQFINNQIGILAGGSQGDLRVSGCDFSRNGFSADGRPTHAILAGRLDLLHIERSVFRDGRGGDHISSIAARTDLLDSHLSDEGGAMTGPLVFIDGGTVTLDGNTIDLGPAAADRPGAVLVAGDVSGITVRGNTLNESSGSVALLRNWSRATAAEAGNHVPAGTVAVSTEGATYHQLRSEAASLRDQARAAAGSLRHEVAQLARWLNLIR